jgi:MAF protein
MATDQKRSNPARMLLSGRSLVLASASPRRSSILRELELEFDVVPADIDETAKPNQTPKELALSLADQKAQAVALLRPDAVVIAADTVVALDDISIGKPADAEEAAAILTSLSGRKHHVHTGVAVRSGGSAQSGVETTEVMMRNLSVTEIDAYAKSGAPLDKAGAYGIQDTDFSPVSSHTGSYLNVVGLPVGLLAGLLLRMGEIHAETAERIRRSDAP